MRKKFPNNLVRCMIPNASTQHKWVLTTQKFGAILRWHFGITLIGILLPKYVRAILTYNATVVAPILLVGSVWFEVYVIL